MGGAAGGKLAAAVSSAGGFGMIGVGSAGLVALLEREAGISQAAGVGRAEIRSVLAAVGEASCSYVRPDCG